MFWFSDNFININMSDCQSAFIRFLSLSCSFSSNSNCKLFSYTSRIRRYLFVSFQMKLIAVLLGLLLFFDDFGRYECAPRDRIRDGYFLERRMRLCGSALSDAVMEVCDGLYPEIYSVGEH